MFNIDISPLVKWAVTVGAAILAVGVAWFAFAEHYEHKGRDKVISQDQGAISRAKTGTNTVDECYSSGGTWNSSVGLCEH